MPLGRTACLLLCLLGSSGALAGFQLSFAELQFAGGSARAVRVELPAAGQHAGRLEVGALRIGDRQWGPLRLDCRALSLANGVVACRDGRLDGIPGTGVVRLNFSYDTSAENGTARLEFPAGGRADLRIVNRGRLDLSLDRFPLARLLPFVPILHTWHPAALLDGALQIDRSGVHFDLRLSDGRFADASGLHAGEGLAGRARGQVTILPGERLDWQVDVAWEAGDVFWNPVLVSPAIKLSARGNADGDHIRIDALELVAPGVSGLSASALLTRAPLALVAGEARLQAGDLALLGPRFALPLLAPAQLERWRVAGSVGGVLNWSDGQFDSAQLDLSEAGFSYLGQRFRVGPLSGEIGWQRNRATPARLRVDGLHWQKLDFEPFELVAEIDGDALTLAPARLPVLDGAIVIDAMRLAKQADGWQGEGGFYMEPVSMARLTEALDLPQPKISHHLAALRRAVSR